MKCADKKATVQLLISLCLLIMMSGVVYPAGAGQQYDYIATISAARANTTPISAGNRIWNCKGTQCRTRGPWQMSTVSACRALAEQIGFIEQFGYAGGYLGKAELSKCNEGIGVKIPVGSRVGHKHVQNPIPTETLPTKEAEEPFRERKSESVRDRTTHRHVQVRTPQGQGGIQNPDVASMPHAVPSLSPATKSDAGAGKYRRQAKIRTTLDREMAVNAAGVRWECKGTACQAQGHAQQPSVSGCRALAARVGALSSYSQGAGSLNRAQLDECNRAAGKAVTKSGAASTASKRMKQAGKQATQSKMVKDVSTMPSVKPSSKREVVPAIEKSQGSATGGVIDPELMKMQQRPFDPNAPRATSGKESGYGSSGGSGGSPVSPNRAKAGMQSTMARISGPETGIAPDRKAAGYRSGGGGPAVGGSGQMAHASGRDPGASPKGNGAAGPRYESESDTFVFNDGATVTGSSRSGARGHVTEKGDIVYDDGTIAAHDPADGSTTFVYPDGSTDTRYSRTDSHGYRPGYDPATDTFIYGDRTTVTGSSPSGERGRVNEKGDIVYDDGTIVTHDPVGGSTTFVHPDGSTETIPGRGASYDGGSGNFVFADGTRVRGTDPSGYLGKLNEDGSIQYSDGTRVRHDSNTGRTTIERPDGTTLVRDEYGGTTRAGPGSDVSAAEGGGTTVRNKRTGVTATFGARDSTTEEGEPKEGDAGSSSGDSSDTGVNSDDSSNDDGDSGSAGSDEDSSGDDPDETDTTDSDDKPDDDSEGGSKISFGEGGAGNSGPSDVVRSIADRLTGMSRERDGDDRPSKDCGSTGQPGIDSGAGRRDCGGGAPDRSSVTPRGNASVAVPIDSRPSGRRGGIGSDCFDPAGCGAGIAGSRILSPFDRSPVINPGADN